MKVGDKAYWINQDLAIIEVTIRFISNSGYRATFNIEERRKTIHSSELSKTKEEVLNRLMVLVSKDLAKINTRLEVIKNATGNAIKMFGIVPK